MANEIGYVTLQVKDLGRAQRFYGPLFGWEFVTGPGGGAHVKNTKVPIGFSTGGPTEASFIYFKVEDFEVAAMRVKDLGGGVATESRSPAGIMAKCTDDQETVFSIWQPAPGFG